MAAREVSVIRPMEALTAAAALHKQGFDTNLNTGEVTPREPVQDDEQGGRR